MPQRIKPFLVYDIFDGGERGTYGDWKHIPESFSATNMLVYRTGELGVRPGLKNVSPTGLSNGILYAFGTTIVPNADCWFIQGTHVYTFKSDGTNLQVSGTTLASTPSGPCPYVEIGNDIYFVSPTDKVYKLSPQTSGAPTLTALTSPAGSTIEVYGDRLLVGNINGSNANRIRYTDALDYTSWPSTNFVDVGSIRGIGGLWAQRGHLIIGKDNGFFIMNGVPGYNDTIRKIQTINGPVSQFDGNTGYGDMLYFRGLGMTAPGTFDGSRARMLHYLDNGMGTGNTQSAPITRGVARLRGLDEGCVHLGSSNRGLAYINNVWTFQQFNVALSGYLTRQGSDNQVLMTDGGGVSANPKFYTWDCNNIGPGIEGSSFSRAGDDSATPISGSVTFPEWYHPWAFEQVVESVTIDFRKFNTGSSTHNHFDFNVRATRRRSPGPHDSTTMSFDEAVSSAGASFGDSTLDRIIFKVGDQGPGNGFQILLSNIKGVSIQRIEIHYDNTLPLRGEV